MPKKNLQKRTKLVKPLLTAISAGVSAVLAEETLISRHTAYIATDEFVRTVLHFRADDLNIITTVLATGSLLMLASYLIDMIGAERAHIRMSFACYGLAVGYFFAAAIMYCIATFFLEGSRYTLADDVCLINLIPQLYNIAQVAFIIGGAIAIFSVCEIIYTYVAP